MQSLQRLPLGDDGKQALEFFRQQQHLLSGMLAPETKNKTMECLFRLKRDQAKHLIQPEMLSLYNGFVGGHSFLQNIQSNRSTNYESRLQKQLQHFTRPNAIFKLLEAFMEPFTSSLDIDRIPSFQ